ncbi:MAG: Gldg family protein [Nitrospirae bacterium]|nr:Gldg family protein [Nitrospirota bacterium]
MGGVKARRKYKTIGQYSLLTFLAAAVLFLANLVSLRLFFRADLTDKNMYTLSDSTKKKLRSLDDVVTIKVYYSKKLPPELAGLERSTRDILGEFRAHSRGKLQYRFLDPDNSDEARTDVNQLGIQPLSLTVRTKDKLEALKAYIGMGVFYLDKSQAIPFVKDITNMEYDLMSAILRVMSEKDHGLTFLTGHGEKDLQDDYQHFKMVLDQSYRVDTHDTSSGVPLPATTDTLIVASPKDLKDQDKFEIDQFLMQGKSVVFLLDPVDLDKKTFMANPKPHNLGDLLEHYGVRVNTNLVEDVSAGMASFSQGYYNFTVPYPFFIKVLPTGMSKENPAVKGVESILLYWASSLDLLKKTEEGLKVEELLSTTDKAWSQQGGWFNVGPQQSPTGDRKSFVIAAALTGKFKSFYAGKTPPPIPGKSVQESRSVLEETSSGKVVVIGDSEFLANQALRDRSTGGNVQFMMNLVDWVTLGEDLIGIRSKVGVDRPLRETTENERMTIKILVTVLVPFLLIAYGLLRYYLRKREQKIYAQLREQASAAS